MAKKGPTKQKPKSKSKSKSSSKSKSKSKELTRYYVVPSEHFKTKDDVIKAFGYTMVKQLDKGGFGTIYIATDNRKKIPVACKWMDLGTASNDPRMLDTRNELTILEQVRHPYVIKVHCHFIVQAEGANNMYIFMELANGGNLYKFLQKQGLPDESLCKKYFAQIVCGINHMHGYGIAHRDIKLQNVLLVEDKRSISGDFLMRVSDFGLSTVVQKDASGANKLNKTICGTPLFMAPELLEKKKYDAFQVDIWALGITLYIMLSMEMPFDFKDRSMTDVCKDMKGNKWEWSDKLKETPSRALNSIMKAMLQPDPYKRIRLAELIMHDWIRPDYQAAHALSDQIKVEEVNK